MALDYSRAGEWILRENSFDPKHLGKCEAVMCLGNGYLGLRSAMEEKYLNETRDLLVNGTFNQFDPSSVTELPNAADMTAVEISVNQERFTLDQGSIDFYSRELNIRKAELKREAVWISPKGEQFSLTFKRVVSLSRLHDFAIQVQITPLSGDAEIEIKSGIDGRVTNTGAQHFTEGDMRLYEGKYIQYVPRTTQSGITFALNTVHRFWAEGEELDLLAELHMEIRNIYGAYRVRVKKGETLRIEKYCNVYTTRDLEIQGKTVKEMQALSLEKLKELKKLAYAELAADTEAEWNRQVWERIPIKIEGNTYDDFAVHFAQYHLRLMVPAHDNRMNIGAKGLTGEGYRGHCFWDTEIFLLPYYAFTQPETARKLEEYRYLTLPGARRKAADNGYQGAMFPWESAWMDDGEVTPEFQNADIVTGLLIKVWSGFIEQHITADVAFGVWLYASVTGDQEFMDRYGYELILDTARFWASRLEDKNRQIHESVNEQGITEFTETVTEDGFFHICDVVGPDEYKEHKTDNAFTNYLAAWNIKKAIACCDLLKAERPGLYQELNEKLELERWYPEWSRKADRIYLPEPNENGVLPQDSTYLTLKEIDLSKYKAQDFVGGIFHDYNQTQINQIQVSKQADALALLFLLEDLFPREVKTATWDYYSERTIHDSSLSLCTHAALAADMRELEEAYRLFEKSTEIDLGPVMTTSDAGIHAASFGGIWQGAVYGFGGLRTLEGRLRIDPCLPEAWKKLTYEIIWHGQRLNVSVTHEQVRVKNLTKTEAVELELCKKIVWLEDEVTAELKK